MIDEVRPQPFTGDINMLKENFISVFNMQNVALKNNVFACFVQYKNSLDNTDPRNGMYFCVMPSEDYRTAMTLHYDKLADLLTENLNKSDHMVDCYYNFVKIPEISRTNIFEVHNNMCKAIQDVSVMKSLFGKYGYHMPKQIHEQTLWNFYHFYNRSKNPQYSKQMQDNYSVTLKKLVAEAYQRYTKDEGMPDAHVSPRIEDHIIDEDYFIKNSIPATYDSVTDDFYDWIKEHINEYPGFIFYKEKKPYMVLKDLSKQYGKQPGINFWKNMTGGKSYNIGFPTCQEGKFYQMVQRYNTRMFDGQTPYHDFLRQNPQTVYKVVNYDDMRNIDSLCKANHVPYCIDCGYTSAMKSEDTRKVWVVINVNDVDNYGHITSRLCEEKRNYFPCRCDLVQEAEKNAPSFYYNPVIVDKKFEDAINKAHNDTETELRIKERHDEIGR